MNYLLTKEEQGPLDLSLWQLIIWSLGLCYFGVVFAVPLRRQVLIRERLKFPSGYSTAVLIGALHGGQPREASKPDQNIAKGPLPADFASLAPDLRPAASQSKEWRANVRLLLLAFLVSGIFTLAMYFIPSLRNIPLFGTVAATSWLWTLNPSLAYVGQGIIMGPATTLHMLLGAVVGWGVLSPMARYSGWAPGDVNDWNSGSKGWLVWTSLAIMLADAVVSLAHIGARSVQPFARPVADSALRRARAGWFARFVPSRLGGYEELPREDEAESRNAPDDTITGGRAHDKADDAPANQQISNRVVLVGLLLSIVFCIACIHIVFGNLVPLYATITAVGVALVLSIMGVRALGEARNPFN
jgi:OPT family oligopeptide transporter